jgi:hypothetical protein
MISLKYFKNNQQLKMNLMLSQSTKEVQVGNLNQKRKTRKKRIRRREITLMKSQKKKRLTQRKQIQLSN